MIYSLLDTDLYKLTMMQAVFHRYTDVNVEYEFKWRNLDKMNFNIPIALFVKNVEQEIDKLYTLTFTDDELEYLKKIRFLKTDFIDYLSIFRLVKKHITIFINEKKEMCIHIKGPWLNTILFEVPILAIVSELYTKQQNQKESDIYQKATNTLYKKINYFLENAPFGMKYGDFGTRRRASYMIHEMSINTQKQLLPNNFIGTSNVYFAKKFNITPLGTHAHEWFQAHQAFTTIGNSQPLALQRWADEYRGDLGIALSDNLTFDAFLVDFDMYFAKLFDGCRHDSGNPIDWTVKLINHYKKLGIDPKTKTALYSDALTFETAIELYKQFNSDIKTAFGIGTYLTNDTGIFTPPQIVLKMTKCNGKPVAKIADTQGKGMCNDTDFETYVKSVIYRKVNGE